MITVDEALNNILSEIKEIGLEKVDITRSFNRVLGSDLYADIDSPLWDNSAMDGYAVRYDDIKDASQSNPISLIVTGDIPAGSTSDLMVAKGESIKIMTGAPMPSGADTVIRSEDTESDSGSVKILKSIKLGENVRKRGENISKGDLVLKKGSLIRPQEIALMATMGKVNIDIYQKPTVAILSTGDELRDIGETLAPGMIYNSNSYSLSAQVLEAGALPVNIGIAKDNLEEIIDKIRSGIKKDLLLISGGVSVGDYDFVKLALEKIGVKMKFWKVAMRPGMPLAYGTINNKPVFGLPGNPASSMVSFEEFVRPTIFKMSGAVDISRPIIEATIMEDLSKKSGMRYFVRGIVERINNEYFVTSSGHQSSANLLSYVKANGIIQLPEDNELVRKGEKVRVKVITWNF